MKVHAERTYSSPLRAEQAAATRDRIVDATVTLLQDNDVSAFGMQDVADRAGVAVRTVYRAFPTKDDLIAGVLQSIKERFEASAGTPPTTADELEASVGGAVRAVYELEPLYRALFATAAGRELHSRSSAGRRAATVEDRVRRRTRRAQRAAGAADLGGGAPGDVVAVGVVPEGLRRPRRRRSSSGGVVGAGSTGRSHSRPGATGPRCHRPRRGRDEHRMATTGGWSLGAREHPCPGRPTAGLPGSAPRAFRDRFRATAARYGLPVDYVDVRFVNDHCYARMRPVGAPEPKPGRTGKAPPAWVLKVIARVHPELRRRTRAARRAIDGKLWHEDRRRWETEGRSELARRRARSLQAEPIEELDDDALVDHLRRAADHLEPGIGTHFDLLPIHNVPVGRLLLACRDWGIEPGDAFDLLAGTSPASTASLAGLRQSRVPSPTPASHRGPSTTSGRPAPPPPQPSTITSPNTAGGSSPSTRRVGWC